MLVPLCARMQILDFLPYYPVLLKDLDSTKVKPLHGGSVGVERHMHGMCQILVPIVPAYSDVIRRFYSHCGNSKLSAISVFPQRGKKPIYPYAFMHACKEN